jgi:serine protease Do
LFRTLQLHAPCAGSRGRSVVDLGRVLLPLVLLVGTPALAAPRPPAFYAAEAHFNASLTLRERVVAQVLLIAAGQQNYVPGERLTLHTFNALQAFQSAQGLAATGALDRTTSDRLFAAARPMFRLWDFRTVAHPARGRAIWMPQGMGLQPVPNRNGLALRDPQGRFRVAYNFFPGVTPDFVYAETLATMRAKGAFVHYAAIKDGWFVISATTAEGEDEYLRYHADGDGILGFVAFWDNARGVVSGERVAVLMSASLGSVMTGRPFVEPPGFLDATPQVAVAPAAVPLARPSPETLPTPAPVAPPQASPPAPVPSVKGEQKVSTGSGFFVDAKGRFVTNAHVVRDCKTVIVKLPDGQVQRASVTTTDGANDLALLQVSGAEGHRHASLRYGARLGEGIATFGYPHIDVLAGGGNFTLGNVTALAGLNDDSRYYQISAPVQAGNSGGPLLDAYGNVAGVVTAKLNVLKVALQSGDFPQNVNFAIKGALLASFLESNGVALTPGGAAGAKLEPADLADLAKTVSALVACQ